MKPGRAPSYLKLSRTGQLERRLQELIKHLEECRICPRHCRSKRLKNQKGACDTGRYCEVASWCIHRGEEPCISGTRGSGTVFFAHCNLSCIFCQNYEISQEWPPEKNIMEPDELADVYLSLQKAGAHNINWVSPSHVVPQAVEALAIAVTKGLSIPIVYNSNGYDDLETLRLMDGIVDIYMPDLKYADDATAEELSDVFGYTRNSQAAILEMWRQVGPLELDKIGVAHRGLLVRHLVLPGNLSKTREVIKFLASLPEGPPALSLMSQYHPSYRAHSHRILRHALTKDEYNSTLNALDEFPVDTGFIQELQSSDKYLPDFKKPGHPFE